MIESLPSENEATAGNSGDEESELNLNDWEELEFEEEPRRPKKPKLALQALSDEFEEDRTGPLASFYADELIVGAATVVKSGKEASVFCCQAHPSMGYDLLAAKHYRPREQRSFKRDDVYQQGRITRNMRTDKAIAQKTTKGLKMMFGMWIGSEYETLKRLHAEGADVPNPIAMNESCILMEYFGERGAVAPQLYNVTLSSTEVGPLFERFLKNLEIMLKVDRVHGDLSPYNILYWQGGLQIIDFPQAVDPIDNPDAFTLFARDLANVYEYFRDYGVKCDPYRLATQLWIEDGRPAPGRVKER